MHFIRYAPESVFPHGIFVPFATQEEAVRQAAWDIYDERSPDTVDASVAERLMGIYEVPSGKDHIEVVDDIAPNALMSAVAAGADITTDDVNYKPVSSMKRVVTNAQLLKKAKPLQGKMAQEAAEAQADWLLRMHRITQAILDGTFEKLSDEDKKVAFYTGLVPQNVAGMPGFCITSGGTSTAGAIALAAATAKTVIGIAAGSVGGPSLAEVGLSFDGVTASAVPVLCEWVSGTNATNPPGTNSTTQTPKQIRGWSKGAASATGAYNWTAEPTVLEVFKKRLLTPNGGLLVVQSPLDREAALIVTASTQFKFFGLRLTAPATVNCHADLEWDE